MATYEQQSLDSVRGVGPALRTRLNSLGLYTIGDLLFHLPLRYEDRTRITAISSLRTRTSAQLEGEVSGAHITFGRRRALVATLDDGSGQIELRFFYFNKAQQEKLEAGGRVRVFGEVRFGRHGFEMVHPELRWLGESGAALDQRLSAVYPSTEGLSQLGLRKLLAGVLAQMPASEPRELLPVKLVPPALQALAQMSLRAALLTVHQPPATADTQSLLNGSHPAFQRLVLEELVANQLQFLRLRARVRQQTAYALAPATGLNERLLKSLPFALTGAQQRVLHEIAADMAQAKAMMRLVQGDVGSGKTLVAALAALAAIGAGKQVALMAPTELLAEQHAQNFARWLAPLGIHSALLAGKTKGKARTQTLAQIASGEVALVLGTHALFQEGVQFADLALVIVDEQHRFGVHQRLQLLDKGRIHLDGSAQVPHQLVMTATPIPRTLAMTAYADLDTSIIDELPPGRTPVTTVVIPEQRRDEVIERVRVAVAEGRQVYWVCTLIEESEQLDAQAAEQSFAQLQAVLPGVRVGLVHGRLKPAEKQALMQSFKQHDCDVLVATTVIEVGVDVANASLMIIENAERLGLAQLHQLRGRVGRGSARSHCVLLYHAPLSQYARERLAVMRATNDGFLIAEKDMELRGPGELLGTRQTGVIAFKIADIARDQSLIAPAQALARQLDVLHVQQPQYADTIPALMQRWLAGKAAYGEV